MSFPPYLLHALALGRPGDHAGSRLARQRRRASAADPADAFRPVTIRRATEDDRAALARLHALESRPPASGVEFLVAEQDGELLAALPLGGGPPVADPFRPTRGLVALLRVRADDLGRGAAGTRRAAA
jgi:hypothetical protein